MVNKRFNRKFRRALGAVLGALAVSSISNIETIGAAFTESTLAGDLQIGDLFKMSKDDKKRIVDEIENNLITQIKYGDWKSGILGPKDLGGPNLNGVTLSYPIKYNGFGNWDYAWTVTIKWMARPSVRITIIKTRSGLDGAGDHGDYLLAPAMSENEFRNYITTHDVPWVGNWIKEGEHRPMAHTVYLTKTFFGVVQNKDNPEFSQRTTYDSYRNFLGNAPAIALRPLPPPPPGALLPTWADADCLTRWGIEGLMDVSIWNKILGDDANIYKMYYDIKTCPPELLSFYYPEEKKEDTFISNSSPAPVPAPSTMNMAPAMAALGVIPATIALANQPAPTPAHVVANNNVTQGSNNAGAAPSAQNGSVSSGSNNVGNASSSQSGFDGKPTNSRHGVGPGVELKESTELVRS